MNSRKEASSITAFTCPSNRTGRPITQRGRTEYGLHGGRHNTDAIDNSAGVDCSDHEVNLKILLAPLATSGQLGREARDKLLRELEPDVAAACVQDNYLQSALLSMEAARARKHGEVFLDVLSYLDKHGLSHFVYNLQIEINLEGRQLSLGLPADRLPGRAERASQAGTADIAPALAPSTEELIDDLASMLSRKKVRTIVED